GSGEHAGGYDAAERADGSDSDGGGREGDHPFLDGVNRRRGGDGLSSGPLHRGGVQHVHGSGDTDSDDLQRYGAGAEYELQLPRDGGGCGGQCEYGFSAWHGEPAGGHDAAERADGADSDGEEHDGDHPFQDDGNRRRGGERLS